MRSDGAGRDGFGYYRSPGQVGPRASRPVTRAASPPLLREGPSPAARAPGFPRGPRRSLRSRRQIILVDYRPLGALARGHARLQVAARVKVAASVTRREEVASPA